MKLQSWLSQLWLASTRRLFPRGSHGHRTTIRQSVGRGRTSTRRSAGWMSVAGELLTSNASELVERLEGRTLLAGVVSGLNVDISRLAGNQDESSIVVNPTNPQQLFAFSNHEASGLFAARSIDGGATWLPSFGADFVIADGSDLLVAAFSDPTATWDNYGNLFISYVNASIDGIPIAVSIDGGLTFTALPTLGSSSVDQPTIVSGPGTAGVNGSVWITWAEGGTIVASGASVTGLGAGAVGGFSAATLLTGVGQFGDITVGPNGQVVVTGQSDTSIQVITDPDGLGSSPFGSFVTATTTNVKRFDPGFPRWIELGTDPSS